MAHKTTAFESAFSQYQGCNNATMVNSGSSADLLMCYLLTNPLNPLLKPGDEILVPSVTWPTQIWSPMMAGLKVVLVDTDPATLNMDLADMARKITAKTRAVFLVHLMANPCDMNAVRELADKHKLIILEDCCEALGSEFAGEKVGNFGLCGSFSFFFSHHICTMEGGMISTNNPEVRDWLRMLRAHGWTRNLDDGSKLLAGFDVDSRYAFVNWGFNVRPTEAQAGFGLEQLKKLPAFNAQRDTLAGMFFEAVKRWPGLSTPTVHPESKPAWFSLPMMIADDATFNRKSLTAYLESHGVETRPMVAGNIARHPVSRVFPELAVNHLPGADRVHKQGFYIGLTPMTSTGEMGRLIELFDKFMRR
jgi:CDP-6-deoxy-D-xylo-4-hexulose-3-dehydrase